MLKSSPETYQKVGKGELNNWIPIPADNSHESVNRLLCVKVTQGHGCGLLAISAEAGNLDK